MDINTLPSDEILAEQPYGVALTAITMGRDTLVFLGIDLTGVSGHKATFCEWTPMHLGRDIPVQEVMNRLLDHPTGPGGRALSRIRDSAAIRSGMILGTSDSPLRVEGAYMDHRNNFRELQRWEDVDTPGLPHMRATLNPIPFSQACSELLASKRLDVGTPVLVLYAYHEVFELSLVFLEPSSS